MMMKGDHMIIYGHWEIMISQQMGLGTWMDILGIASGF